MRIGALIQARMSSTRLRGKVLSELGDRPALDYVLERLSKADGLDLTAVITSTRPDDDPIEKFCADRGARCYRGPLEDVLGRFLGAADHFELDAVERVNGDSPFLDQALVSKGVETFRGGSFDVVTNVFPRSFPVGQSVEIISNQALEEMHSSTDDPADREHVTPFIYRNRERFRIRNFAADADFSGESLALDGPTDAAELTAVVERMDRPVTSYSWREVLALRASTAGDTGGRR